MIEQRHPEWQPHEHDNRGDPDHHACRGAYLARFPEAEFMTRLTDFCFASIRIVSTRQVAGFGAARDVEADGLRRAVQQATDLGDACDDARDAPTPGQPR